MHLRLGLTLIGILGAALVARSNGPESVVTVNAASYKAGVAPGSIAAAFGAAMCPGTAAATSIPLPTELDGVTVDIVSADAQPVRAPLFYVSPGQINFLVPNAAKSGEAQVIVWHA